MRVLLATAALLALGMGGAGAVQYSQGPDSALDNNDPYYVDTSATPAPMRFAEARAGAGMFAADGSLFCRGKQCPLSRTAAGDPLCCPTTDHCCPATYRCDESDANSVKCIPTASTPAAAGSNGGTSVTVSASESSDDASEDSGSEDSEDSTADAGDAPAADAATGAAAAEESSDESSEDSAGGATAGSEESSEASDSSSDAAAAVPKFRQNIIIVKNINVLTKMNQKADGGDASSGSSDDSEESSEESSESS